MTVPKRSGRPIMPKAYGLKGAREGSGLLPWSWAEERLLKARNYWVVTTSPEGVPHAAPVWGLWLASALYFSTDPHSRKGRNLTANPRIVVHLESGDETVIVQGTVAEVAGLAALRRFADAYEPKYNFRPDVSRAGRKNGGVYMFKPHVVNGWTEADFPGGATRWVF